MRKSRFTVVKDTRSETNVPPSHAPLIKSTKRTSPRSSRKKRTTVIRDTKLPAEKNIFQGKETSFLDTQHVKTDETIYFNGRKFHVLKILGKGAFGSVFKVQSEKNQIYSLKVVNLPEDSHKKKKAVVNFNRELNMLLALNREGCKQNMICLKDYSKNKDQLFLLLDYAEGVPLHEIRNEYDLQTPKGYLGFLIIFQKTVEQYMEYKRLGIVHKDIKPQNILYDTKNNTVTIIDVGLGCYSTFMPFLSIHENDLLECLPEFSGTLGFLAPEVIKMQVPTYKSDIFSLGATMFYLFKGKHLFGTDKDKYNQNTKMGWKTWYGLNQTHPGLYEIIQGMTEIEPMDRLELEQILVKIRVLMQTFLLQYKQANEK